MLFVVVHQAVVPTVVLSVFMFSLPSLTFPGLMVLPYHLNIVYRVYRVIIFIKIKLILIITLLVVVTQAVVPSVELSVFMLMLVSLLLPGIVALPYHFNLALSIVIIFIQIKVVYIILFAVLALALMFTVELSVFVRSIPSLILPGLLAPPCHLNHLFYDSNRIKTIY